MKRRASRKCDYYSYSLVINLSQCARLWNALCTHSNRFDLLFALVDAARRESGLLHGHNVWNSLYFRLFAVLVRPDLRQLRPWSWSSEHLTRILEILTSDYVSRTIADTVQTEEERQIGTITIQMTFSCIFDVSCLQSCVVCVVDYANHTALQATHVEDARESHLDCDGPYLPLFLGLDCIGDCTRDVV